MNPLDYGESFVIGNGPSNEVRFWAESRTRLIDERTGVVEDYVQCGSCKSENTFAASDLFHADNYDFLPIFGPRWGLVFRRKAYCNDNYRDVRPADQWWNGQTYHLVEATGARRLETSEQVRAATYAFVPIVAQVEIADAGTGMRAILEFPVKTMNTNRQDDAYQVDTGPVALPDLQRHECSAHGLRLAFVAFNREDFADVVVEVATASGPGAPAAPGDATAVYHFSERLTLAATNRLYGAG